MHDILEQGRTRSFSVTDHGLIDGLLDVGGSDLLGFYIMLKRFVSRKPEDTPGVTMSFSVRYYCKRSGVGQEKFYRLMTLLWQVGLVDVRKETLSEGGKKGWQNRYVIHDYPPYEENIHVIRIGSFTNARSRRYSDTGIPASGIPEAERKNKITREYSGGGYTRARKDTCIMSPGAAPSGTRAAPVPPRDTPADSLRPAVAKARAMVKQITGVDLPEAVLEKMAVYDDEQIHNAVMVLDAYLARNDVDDVGGFLLQALAEQWRLEPAPRRKREPKKVARASGKRGRKHQVSLNSLYV
ncbi:MAG: hypothetical protein QMC81_11145 [Thermoanaerobacterales bacterium]|nr:hypothetical protein [Thermoanaerobacterales bacterium]